jgi:6-phosphogluconolactonase (cycloisomerase 2 family)
MKFSKLSQLLLVSLIGLVVASLLTACQLVTVDFVYVTDSASAGSGSAGQIQIFAVDSQTGALRLGAPTVPSGGINPVAVTTDALYANLYVANYGSDNVIHFSIAGNGVLTKADTLSTTTPPTALAVSENGKYLFVLTGATSATLTEYALNSSGTIGAVIASEPLQVPGYTGDEMVPTAITVLNDNSAVYATAYDLSAYNPGGSVTSTANPGWVFGFGIGSSGALSTTTNSPYEAGIRPQGIVATPVNHYVYVTDFASNDIVGYQIQSGDVLAYLVNGPFYTANEPNGIAIDPRGTFLYSADSLSDAISAYTVSLQNGTLTALSVASTGSAATDTYPVGIAVDPALGRFVYTADELGNTLTGERLNPGDGTLEGTVSSPYPTGFGPTALTIIPHGNHSLEAVYP